MMEQFLTPPRKIALLARTELRENPDLQQSVQGLRDKGMEIHDFVLADEIDEKKILGLRRHGFDRLLVAGGDGTLNRVVASLMKGESRQRLPLGVVPMGTANDFASQSLESSSLLPQAVEDAATGPLRRLDVGFVNGRPFINAVSGGAIARITTEVDVGVKSRLGRVAYYLSGLRVATELEAQIFRFLTPTWEKELKCYAFVVGNGRAAGGGFKIAPEARLDDGFLDLLIIPEQSLLSLTSLVKELLRPEPQLSDQHVLYFQVSSVEIEAETSIQVNADGEPFFGDRFVFTIEPEAVEVAVDPSVPAIRG